MFYIKNGHMEEIYYRYIFLYIFCLLPQLKISGTEDELLNFKNDKWLDIPAEISVLLQKYVLKILIVHMMITEIMGLII